MYFGLYRTIQNRRDMQGEMPGAEMDVSHRFTRELSEWLKSLFTRPFDAETQNGPDQRREQNKRVN